MKTEVRKGFDPSSVLFLPAEMALVPISPKVYLMRQTGRSLTVQLRMGGENLRDLGWLPSSMGGFYHQGVWGSI
jgi:hypothetical protein